MKRTALKRKAQLRRMSKRRQAESKEYMKLRAEFLLDHPVCQIWLETIGKGVPYAFPEYSCEIHHRCAGKNRKATYLRTDTWMAVSKIGHRFIYDNPKLAYERGWLLKAIPEEPNHAIQENQ